LQEAYREIEGNKLRIKAVEEEKEGAVQQATATCSEMAGLLSKNQVCMACTSGRSV
jgi:hypothetical protein